MTDTPESPAENDADETETPEVTADPSAELQAQIDVLRGQLDTTEADKNSAVLDLMRVQVARDKGLPEDAAELLVGASREELEQRADLLLGVLRNRVTGPIVPQEGKYPENVSTADSTARKIFLGHH